MVIVLIVQWAQNWVLITAVMNHLSLLLLLSGFSRVQLCLCDPIDGSPPGSPVSGILQARTLEWVAISFSEVVDISPCNLDSKLVLHPAQRFS